jgi:hypothetical protein
MLAPIKSECAPVHSIEVLLELNSIKIWQLHFTMVSAPKGLRATKPLYENHKGLKFEHLVRASILKTKYNSQKAESNRTITWEAFR